MSNGSVYLGVQQIEIEVINSAGQLIYISKFSNSFNQIDVGNLSAGIYMLIVKGDSENSTVTFVKD